jgi:hypothetical protein
LSAKTCDFIDVSKQFSFEEVHAANNRRHALPHPRTCMKKYFFSLLLSLVFTPALFSNQASAQERRANEKLSSQPLIGNLKKTHKTYGCDCTLQTLKASKNTTHARFVFESDAARTPAWMNLDGSDVELKLVYASLSTKGVTRGSRSHSKYRANEVSVLIKYVVSATCPEENPDCDSVGYTATITVTKGSRKQTIKAIGMCRWC